MSAGTSQKHYVPFSANAAQTVKERFARGDGYVVITDFPVDPLDIESAKRSSTAFMESFGELASQDDEGTLAYVLEDEGEALGYGKFGDRRVNPKVRASKTNARLAFHNDSGARWGSEVVDVLGTLMVSDGIAGGDVVLSDGRAAYEILKRENPGAVERLKRPFAFDTESRPGKDGLPFTWGPIILDYRGHFELRVSMSRVEMAADFLGTPLTTEDKEAINALEATFHRKELMTRLHLQPGEFLLLDDRRMVHLREEFEDGEAQENKRRLIRLWAYEKR